MSKKNSFLINSQVPDYVKELYTNSDGEVLFISFIKAYYEWAEQTGEVEYYIHNADKFFDVDEVFTDVSFKAFRDYYFTQFLPGIPTSVVVDKSLLIKHGREFYINKTNENSFKFLFRILYNEDIDIFVPHKQLLIASDKVQGVLKQDNKLQDSFFWQRFSYQIKSDQSIELYRQIIENLLHPAGFKLFGQLASEIYIENIIKIYTEFIISFVIEISTIIKIPEIVFSFSMAENFLLSPTTGTIVGDEVSKSRYSYEPTINVIYAANSKALVNDAGGAFVFLQGVNTILDDRVNFYVHVSSGTGSGQVRAVSAFEESFFGSKKVTVSSVFSTVPDDTSKFDVFQQTINKIGVAQAGAAATITLWADEYDFDDLYNDYQITILYGTGAGQSRYVSDYVGSTKVATVDAVWSTNPDATSVYLLEKYEGNDSGYFTSFANYSLKHFKDSIDVSDVYVSGDLGVSEVSLNKKDNFVEIDLRIKKN